MRILFFANDFPSPWLPTKATFNFELMRSLARRHDVHVVTPISWLDEMRHAKRAVGVEAALRRRETRNGLTIHYPRYYYTPKIGRGCYDRFLWHSVKPTLFGKLDGFRPDAVIGYWPFPDGAVAVKYARMTGAPAFVMAGGSGVLIHARKSSLRRRKIAAVLEAADGVFAVSEHLRERVIELGVPSQRVHLTYRGVDRETFAPGDKSAARRRLGLQADVPLFLYVGRLEPVKGLEVLIEAGAALKHRGGTFEILLVGEGSQRLQIEASVTARGLGDCVRLVGAVSHRNLVDWYRAADWSVLTSHSEGVPNALLESHACGTPFIATSVGGVPEIAIDGVDRIVPPADHMVFSSQMSEALKAPLPDRDFVASRVSGLDSAAEKIGQIITAVLDQRPTQNAARYRPNAFRQIVRKTLAAVMPRSMLLTGGSSQKKDVFLTFDDGPHPEHTPKLLDVLSELGFKATFFVIGREAARFPKIVRRIADEGHALGNHTWSHPQMSRLPARAYIEEIERTRECLAEITGMPVRLFRPPMGRITARQLLTAWRMRQSVVLWNVDPRDYQCHSVEEVHRGLPPQGLRGGDIVLLHDNRPLAAEVLPSLAAGSASLRFSTILNLTRSRASTAPLESRS